MKTITTNIPPALAKTLQGRADGADVTLATYVAAVLTIHLDAPPLTGVAPRPSGLGGANRAMRRRVSRMGVEARTKEADHG